MTKNKIDGVVKTISEKPKCDSYATLKRKHKAPLIPLSAEYSLIKKDSFFY